MKVTIAGAGNVGVSIASDLRNAGHQVLLIEQDPDLVAKLRPTLDVRWYEGDACEVSTRHQAGIADSDVVVAATGDYEDNLVVSLLAKQEFAVPRVVARVNHPKNQWLFNQSWGVDVSVSTPAPADRPGRRGGVGRRPGLLPPSPRRGTGIGNRRVREAGEDRPHRRLTNERQPDRRPSFGTAKSSGKGAAAQAEGNLSWGRRSLEMMIKNQLSDGLVWAASLL
jgi:hypothetical protein